MIAHYLKSVPDRYMLMEIIRSANDAILICHRKKVDLILMDVCTAQNASGLDATRAIKEHFSEMVAHNNMVGVGRLQDWTSHQIEHELSALYDCAHGAGLAVTMPAVFTYTMSHDVMRFAQIAVRVWGCQMDFTHPERTAKEGIEALRNFLISIGMPKNFHELGAKEEDIDKLAYTCCYGKGNEGGSIGGFVPLNQEDVAAIYRRMLES